MLEEENKKRFILNLDILIIFKKIKLQKTKNKNKYVESRVSPLFQLVNYFQNSQVKMICLKKCFIYTSMNVLIQISSISLFNDISTICI